MPFTQVRGEPGRRIDPPLSSFAHANVATKSNPLKGFHLSDTTKSCAQRLLSVGTGEEGCGRASRHQVTPLTQVGGEPGCRLNLALTSFDPAKVGNP